MFLLSLTELMFEYKLNDFALMLSSVISASRDLHTSDSLKEPICTVEYANALGITLDGLAIMCGNFNADPSLIKQIKSLSASLITGSADSRESVLCAQLKSIIEAVHINLDLRKFMFVPSDQATYWDDVEIFGDNFLIGFPKAAVVEAVEAGNCYAAGRWTASVFHCMRVAEHGLRRLAKRLRVTIKSKGKNCPIEYGDWETIITAIRNKITEIRKLPRGPKREETLRFFSLAADHCEYMKDIWRNEISHTRRRYNKAEALAVLNRVRDFVNPLAKTDADKALKKRMQKAQKVAGHASGFSSLAALRQFLSTPATTSRQVISGNTRPRGATRESGNIGW